MRFYRVAVVDLCLGEDNPQNREGMDVLKHIWELDEGTRAIVWSGYTGETPLLKLFIEYRISSVADKNPEFVKEFDKSKASAKLLEAIDIAFSEAKRETQRFSARAIWQGSPFSFINGMLARDIQLRIGGGTMSELREFLGELCEPLAPWLQSKEKTTPIEVGGRCIGYQIPCWSREFGDAVVVRFGRGDFFKQATEKKPIETLISFGKVGKKLFENICYHYCGEVYHLEDTNFDQYFKRPTPRRSTEYYSQVNR